MPQDGPTEWTTALRENGRLSLGPERNRLLITLALPAGLLLLNVFQLSNRASWGFWEYFRVAFIVLAAAVLVGVLNSLRTRRWVVVVDATGVAQGNRQLTWPEISAVTLVDDEVVLRQAADAQELKIGKETLGDLPAFAQWLTSEITSRTGENGARSPY